MAHAHAPEMAREAHLETQVYRPNFFRVEGERMPAAGGLALVESNRFALLVEQEG